MDENTTIQYREMQTGGQTGETETCDGSGTGINFQAGLILL